MDKTQTIRSGMDRKFIITMLKIALPIMLQNLVTSSLNMADTVMIGTLGEVEIAAVGIANQYFFFYSMILIGLSGGCSVFIAQYWGKKDHRNIRRMLGLGMISVLMVSVFFMVFAFIDPERIIRFFNRDAMVVMLGGKYLFIVLFSYLFTAITFMYSYSLRSIGNTVTPLLVNVAALFCNIFFNYMLIFGHFGAPALGVEGAAIATLIARVLEAIVLVLLVYRGSGVFAIRLNDLKGLSWAFFRKAYRIILPVLMNDVSWAAASLMYSVVYGRMGTGATAAVQITNTVSNLFMVVTFGMASASAIMTGNSIGQGKEEETLAQARKFLVVSFFVSLIIGLGLALASPSILDLFNVSGEVRRSALIMLYIISVIFAVRFLGMVIIVGILRGAGDARSALLIEGSTMWLIGVPLTILGAFVFKFPVHLVYGLAILEEVAKFLLGLVRLKSRKWIHNVT